MDAKEEKKEKPEDQKRSLRNVLLLDNAILHWSRMIKWVKTQNPIDPVNDKAMLIDIEETWQGPYCSLCCIYDHDNDSNQCIDDTQDNIRCPLDAAGEQCNRSGSAWNRVIRQKTWRTWLPEAERMLTMLRYLQGLCPRPSSDDIRNS